MSSAPESENHSVPSGANTGQFGTSSEPDLVASQYTSTFPVSGQTRIIARRPLSQA
jgi:hypothetical protein